MDYRLSLNQFSATLKNILFIPRNSVLQATDKPEEEQEDLSIVDQVLIAFYQALDKNSEFSEISARLKKETNYSDVNMRRVLYGDE